METDTRHCEGGIEFCVLLTPDDIRAAGVVWPVPVEALSARGRLIRAILEIDETIIMKGG